MFDCNDLALDLFRAKRSDIVGTLFAALYPNRGEFDAAGRRMAPFLAARILQYDNRIMQRIDGTHFWVTVRGHAFNRDNPYELTAWTFSDVPHVVEHKNATVALTKRERDVAALLIDKLSSKEIARTLNISPKTVDIHRASLRRKYAANTTEELISYLIS